MNAISEIVEIMSSEDKKAFQVYLNKKNKRKDVHNINFFKLLETDDINTLKNKYKTKKSDDAYYALRKRIYDSLIEFMANRTFANDTSAEHEVLRLLVGGRAFIERKRYKTAFKCLSKAEAKAIPLEHFSLLNEIYHTQIQFAHLQGGFNLSTVVAKFTANREKLRNEEQLNLAYALLRKELANIHHKGKVTDFRALIMDTMASLGVSLQEILTFKSLYQILFIANEYAAIHSDFSLIESFIAKSFAFISERKELAEKHLYYHIYILYFIANIHFRNREFTASLTCLMQMEEQMLRQGGRYRKQFFLRWSLLHALNEHYSGSPGKAIVTVQKALQQQGADPVDVNDLRLCLAVFYLQQGDRAAFKQMRLFAHTDSWYEKRMSMDWVIKKALVEIILQAEFENTEQALSRIKSFKRRYKKYLFDVQEERVYAYVQQVEQYIQKPEIIKSPAFIKEVDKFLQPGKKTQDIFVLSFIGWLVAKIRKQPVYDTILELLKQ